MSEHTQSSELDQLLAEMDAKKREGVALPKHQEKVDRFIRSVLEKNSHGGLTQVEIKSLEISHYAGSSQTFININVGMVGDEGTAASVFGRDHRLVVIGKRGGYELLNGKKPSYRYGRHNALYALT